MGAPEVIIVTLTRQEIIRGQLETAILLWFAEKDVVSIHALAAGAHEVVNAVAGKDNRTFLESKMDTLPKKMRDAIRMPQNFFKHADRDPNHVLDFPPRATEYIMYDAAITYDRIYHDLTPLMRTFMARFEFSWGEGMEIPERPLESTLEIFPFSEFSALTRREFLLKGLARLAAS